METMRAYPPKLPKHSTSCGSIITRSGRSDVLGCGKLGVGMPDTVRKCVRRVEIAA
jgi:hypothetical protein